MGVVGTWQPPGVCLAAQSLPGRSQGWSSGSLFIHPPFRS